MKIGKFNEGDEVDFKYVNKGYYENIVSIQAKHNGQKPKMMDLSPKDLQIVRMSLLKTAPYLSNNTSDPEADIMERTDDILNVAKRFERYVTEIGEVDISAEYFADEDMMETAGKRMNDVRPLMCGYYLEVFRFETPDDRYILSKNTA